MQTYIYLPCEVKEPKKYDTPSTMRIPMTYILVLNNILQLKKLDFLGEMVHSRTGEENT